MSRTFKGSREESAPILRKKANQKIISRVAAMYSPADRSRAVNPVLKYASFKIFEFREVKLI